MSGISADLFRALIAVQVLDAERVEVEEKLESIEPRREELRAQLDDEKARHVASKEALKKLQVAHKEKEIALKEQEAAVDKHNGELSNIKSNDAYKALLTEIEHAKGKIDALETEILGMLDEISAAEAAVAEEQSVVKTIEAEFAGRAKEIDDDEAALNGRLAELAAERAGKTAGVEPALLAHYDKVRERHADGVALAELKEGACSACHVKVPPTLLQDVQKGEEFVTCESCYRILYNLAKGKTAPAASE